MYKSIIHKMCIASLILFAGVVMVYGHALAEKKSGPDIEIVNINSASVKELAGLSGIGKTKAEAIIAYRSKHGKFESVDDIQRIKGIGKKTFENIRNSIAVR